MFCKNCGSKLEENNKICPSCGTDNETKTEELEPVEEVQEISTPQPEKKKEGKAIASLVIGIISIFLWPLGITIILSIIGLILGIGHKGKSGKKVTGIILNIISIILEIIVIVIAVAALKLVFNETKEAVGKLEDGTIEEYIKDSNLAPLLGILNDWEDYKDLRTGELGKKVDINGEFRILSDKEDYVIINNNKYYKYASFNNKEDNYEYGSVEIIKGEEGLNSYGIELGDMEDIFTSNIGNLSMNNVYIVTYKPSKKIENGAAVKDYEETTRELWILVNHKKEGIQAVNVDLQNQTFSSYVKVKD